MKKIYLLVILILFSNYSNGQRDNDVAATVAGLIVGAAAVKLAVEQYKEQNCDKIILICGSGNGIQMTANKHQNIRCALCWNMEIAVLARTHNDANAIALPARYINEKEALEIINAFISTGFEGGRHNRRKEKISCV